MKPNRNRRLRHRVYRGASSLTPPAGELVVEYFSDRELIGWRAHAEDIQAYHYLWFFELERQRAANHKQLLEALGTVPGISIELTGWGRALEYKYSNSPLSCVGSLKWVGGRFNYGTDIDSARFVPFPALYLAQDFETGLRELHGLLRENDRAGLTERELALCSESGVAWAAVAGTVYNIFDVTRVANLRAFAEVLATFKLSRNVTCRRGKAPCDSPPPYHNTGRASSIVHDGELARVSVHAFNASQFATLRSPALRSGLRRCAVCLYHNPEAESGDFSEAVRELCFDHKGDRTTARRELL